VDSVIFPTGRLATDPFREFGKGSSAFRDLRSPGLQGSDIAAGFLEQQVRVGGGGKSHSTRFAPNFQSESFEAGKRIPKDARMWNDSSRGQKISRSVRPPQAMNSSLHERRRHRRLDPIGTSKTTRQIESLTRTSLRRRSNSRHRRKRGPSLSRDKPWAHSRAADKAGSADMVSCAAGFTRARMSGAH